MSTAADEAARRPGALLINPIMIEPRRLTPGADLAAVLFDPSDESAPPIASGDVVVVSAWVISLVEDRVRPLRSAAGETYDDLVEAEATLVLRHRAGWRLVETHQGLIAGQDEVVHGPAEDGRFVLLPVDADRSARRLRDAARHRWRLDIAVVLECGIGRPWRRGLVGTALGSAGLRALAPPSDDGRGGKGQRCVADEVASAAALALQLAESTTGAMAAGAVVRGLPSTVFGSESVANDVVRPLSRQLFR